MRPMNKKGFAISEIWPIALTIGITILGVAYLLQCLSTVKSGMTANSVEANAVSSGITALAQIPSNMSTIVTIIIAAILIGILVYYFAFRK